MMRPELREAGAEHILKFSAYVSSLSSRMRPTVDEFDLMAIYPLAPYVVVVDVMDDPPRLHCRFVGTQVAAMHGADATGRNVEDLFGDSDEAQDLLRRYWRVAETCEAQFMTSHVMRPDEPDDPFVYERLMVPLVDDDGRVTRIAALIHRRLASGRALPMDYSVFGWHAA